MYAFEPFSITHVVENEIELSCHAMKSVRLSGRTSTACNDILLDGAVHPVELLCLKFHAALL